MISDNVTGPMYSLSPHREGGRAAPAGGDPPPPGGTLDMKMTGTVVEGATFHVSVQVRRKPVNQSHHQVREVDMGSRIPTCVADPPM